MSRKNRARRCAQDVQKCAPRALRLEGLEIRNYLSASPSGISAAPQVTIIPSVNTAVSGYTPAQVANAYGFNQIKFGNTVGNGAGQTIAIVDAYDDPSITINLASFDKQFGLPSASLTKVNETGGSKMPVASQGWDLEISLDVEWAHAEAPGANILLVEANSSGLSDLMTAVNYARSQPAVGVVSMSWGAGEFSGQQSLDSYFTTPAGHSGVTFVASSGDGGAAANWPAVSPNVVAVGGTTLSISGTSYSSETAWSGSGGGTSAVYSTPSYQVGVQSTGHRTVPDVSFDANPSTGLAVYDTAGGSAGWIDVGGTSAGAPQWAALVAIADQGRALSNQAALSNTDTSLYKLSAADFHDVTTGSNGQFSAKTGYDEVTGRGSPYANLVARDLVGATFTTAPVSMILTRPGVIVVPSSQGGSAGAHATPATIGTASNAISVSMLASLSVTASGATIAPATPSAAVGTDAVLTGQSGSSTTSGNVEADATLIIRNSAADECFAEDNIDRPEYLETASLSAAAAVENSATTDLAILAGAGQGRSGL